MPLKIKYNDLDLGSRNIINLADAVNATDAVTKQQLDAAVAGMVTGSGVANQLPYWTGASTIGSAPGLLWDNSQERLRIHTSGGYWARLTLEVDSANTSQTGSDLNGIDIRNSSAPVGGWSGIAFSVNDGRGITGIMSKYIDLVNAYGQLHFMTRGPATSFSTKMVIEEDGNVGIGTETPNWKVDVRGGSICVEADNYVLFNGPNSTDKSWAIGLDIAAINGQAALRITTYNGGERYISLAGSDAGRTSMTDHFILNTQTGKIGIGVIPADEKLLLAGSLRIAKSDGSQQYTTCGQSIAGVPNNGGIIANNADSSGNYIVGAAAVAQQLVNGYFALHTAPFGIAGSAISWTEVLRVTNSGDIGVGVVPSSATIHLKRTGVNPSIRIDSDTNFGTGAAFVFNSADATSDRATLSVNAGYTSNWYLVDSSKPSWLFQLRTGEDDFVINRASPGSTTWTPLFHVLNNGKLKLTQYGSGSLTGTLSKVLGVDSSGNMIEVNSTDVGVQGAGNGVADYVARWTDANTISTGILKDDGVGLVSSKDGSTIAIEMSIPSNVSASATTGGTLAAGTYYVKVVAEDGTGTTAASSEANATVDGTTTNAVSVSWSAVTGATQYRVYVGTSSNGQDRYWTTTSTSFTVTAFGAGDGSTTGTPPTVTTAYTNKISSNGDSWNLNGSFGVGTTPSIGKLHVRGSDNNTIFRFEDNSGNNLITGSNNGQFTVGSSIYNPKFGMHNGGGTYSIGGPFFKFETVDTGGLTSGSDFIFDAKDHVGTGTTTSLNLIGSVGHNSGSGSHTQLLINGTYNQTGTATGNIIGIDYSPTVTSVLGTHYGMLIRSGFVGIGTGSPTTALHVVGGGGGIGTIRVQGTSSTDPIGVEMLKTTGSSAAFMGLDTDGSYGIRINTLQGGVRIYTNSVERIRVQDSTGNVGIGTNSPTSLLHVDNGGGVQNVQLGVFGYLSHHRGGGYNFLGFDAAWNSNGQLIAKRTSNDGVGGIVTWNYQRGLHMIAKAPVTANEVLYDANLASEQANVKFSINKSDGFVGVNKTIPDSQLHVYHASSDLLRLEKTSSEYFLVNSNLDVIRNRYDGNPHYNSYWVARAGNTPVQNGDRLFWQEVSSNNSGAGGSTNWRIEVFYNGDGTNRRGDFRMGVAQLSGYGSHQFRMVQNAAGKVTLIGSVNNYNPDASTGAGSVKAATVLSNYSQTNIVQFDDNSNNTIGVISDSGFLGLGLDTPQYRVHLKGTTADNTASSLFVENSNATEILRLYNDGQFDVSGEGLGKSVSIIPGGINVGKVQVGGGSTATGTGSIVFGLSSTSSGQNSFAGGIESTASEQDSVALGRYVFAQDIKSIAIGAFLDNQLANSALIGIGFNANNKPTIQHSNSVGIAHGGQYANFSVRGFDSTFASNWTATGANINTTAAHPFSVGDRIALGANNPDYRTVTSVTDANNFVVDSAPTNNTSGSVIYYTSDWCIRVDNALGEELAKVDRNGVFKLSHPDKNYTIFEVGKGLFRYETDHDASNWKTFFQSFVLGLQYESWSNYTQGDFRFYFNRARYDTVTQSRTEVQPGDYIFGFNGYVVKDTAGNLQASADTPVTLSFRVGSKQPSGNYSSYMNLNMYSSNSDQIEDMFRISDDETAHFKGNIRVGAIGSAPEQAFHAEGSSNQFILLRGTSAGNHTGIILENSGSADDSWKLYRDSNGVLKIIQSDTQPSGVENLLVEMRNDATDQYIKFGNRNESVRTYVLDDLVTENPHYVTPVGNSAGSNHTDGDVYIINNAAHVATNEATNDTVMFELDVVINGDATDQWNVIEVKGVLKGEPIDIRYLLKMNDTTQTATAFCNNCLPTNTTVGIVKQSGNGKPAFYINSTSGALSNTAISVNVMRGARVNGSGIETPPISNVVIQSGVPS